MKILLIALIVFCTSPAFSWGATGHKAAGYIAEQYLTPKAKEAVTRVLTGTSLPFASTWMDEVRSNPKYYKLADWHWVSLPEGQSYAETQKNPNGDAIEAIQRMIASLKEGGLSPEDEAVNLKILIHLVEDLQMPLHARSLNDHGGGDVKVKWMSKDTNLHKLWDGDMIDETHLNYTDFAASIEKPTQKDIGLWQQSTPEDWAHEDLTYSPQVYDIGNGQLGSDYLTHNLNTIRLRLLQAGVRLAGILNEIYG